MECTGKIQNIATDWQTGKFNVTFSLNESSSINEIAKLRECEKVTIKMTKHRNRRSRDANALLWVCLGKIAEVLRADKWDIYLQMLKRYGKFTDICVHPSVVDDMKLQWRECEVVGEMKVNGQEAVQMLCYFGSSTYNTKEFSVLLDGVISEMKEMGIEAPASEDMRRALEQWEKMQNEKTV